MFIKYAMKNPILMIGILLMVIFLFSLRDKDFWGSRARKLKPTSCRSVMVMLKKRLPKNWEGKCNDNNLEVSIKSDITSSDYKNIKLYKAVMYRELANDLMFVSKNSPEDGLSRVYVVVIKVHSDKMDINAVTEGKYIARIASLKSQEVISEHLKATVNVKEFFK